MRRFRSPALHTKATSNSRRTTFRPTADRENLTIVSHETHCLIEIPQTNQSVATPDDRRSGKSIGIDAGLPTGGDQSPARRRGVAGRRIDDVMDALCSHAPTPDDGARAGNAAVVNGDHLVDVVTRHGGIIGDTDGPAELGGGACHGNVAPDTHQDAGTELSSDAGGGSISRECLGRRAQVKSYAAGDPHLPRPSAEMDMSEADDRPKRRR